ncbi:MAG: serine hydrolase [Clostridiales bacterium]|nr:serine hydrolase [Candidatus Blautia equi]
MKQKSKKRFPTRSQVFIVLLLIALTAVSTLAAASTKKVSDLRTQVMALNTDVALMLSEKEELAQENEALRSSLPDERFSALFKKIQTLEESDLLSLEEYIDQLLNPAEEPDIEDIEDISSDDEEDPSIPSETDDDFLSETPGDSPYAPELRSMLPEGNGSWSVYTCNLTDREITSIDSHRMQAASLIKLYIMGAVYADYDDLCARYGTSTIEDLLYPMITVSDNDASNKLVEYLGHGDTSTGMAIVNFFCQSHGFKDSHMGRLLLHSNEYDDNYTSVNDCGRFLTAVYEGASGQGNTLLAHPDSMYRLLKLQNRQHKIPANLPATVHAANKTGELADVENDAAILYHDADGNDLIICFMSEYLSAVGSAQSRIAEISRSVYDHYNP